MDWNNLKIKQNVKLAPYTTFRIGGPAKYFFEAKNTDEIIKVINLAKKNQTPFFILGGGGNILVSDKGFDGLVIKISNSKIRIGKQKVVVGAGAPLAKLLQFAAAHNLAGLEFLAGLPGTVGGAVFGNAGWANQATGNFVERVIVSDKAGKVKILNQKECRFSYRESRFKKTKEIILEVVLKLPKGKSKKIKKEIKFNIKDKINKQPTHFHSAGCIFKNHTGKIPKGEKIPKEFKKKKMIPAGWLIEQARLKGKKIGRVQISEKHANFIVNLGDAKAKEVLKLISLIKNKVRNKFGIQLREEVQYLN